MSGVWLKQTFRGIPSPRWHETSAGSPEVSALMRGSLPRPSGEGLEVGHFKWRQAFLPVLSCFRDEFDRQECLSLPLLPLKSQNVQSLALRERVAKGRVRGQSATEMQRSVV